MGRKTQTHSIIIKPGDKTVAGDVDVGYWRAPEAGTLIACYVMDSSAVANNESNYITVNLKNVDSDQTGTTVMATGNSNAASGNWVEAGIPKALTNSTTTANLQFDAGDILELSKADTGTKAFSDASFQIDVVYGRG